MDFRTARQGFDHCEAVTPHRSVAVDPPIDLRHCPSWRSLLAITLLVSGFTNSVAADDWPQFLGPQRDGISREGGLISNWPQNGPRELWRTPCGPGMSGLAIADGRVLTLFQTPEGQYCTAYEAETGKQLWQTQVAAFYKNQMGNGPRATPTIAGQHAWIFTGDGVLACLQVSDGKVVWTRNVVRESGGEVADYGMASSPLLTDAAVVVTVGAPSATLAAFERQTGKPLWTSGGDSAAGYSSPALRTFNGQPQIVSFHGAGAAGIDPANGRQLWSYPYITDYDCNIATPIVVQNQVLISAGENHGSVLLKADANSPTGVSERWASQGIDSVLRAEWQTPVLIDGYLYGMDNKGSAGPITNLACVEAATGKQMWLERRFGKGNLIAAGNTLFISTMKGELVMVRATPNGFQELGRRALIGQTRQAPAIANGRLYLRDDAEIVCLDVKAR